VNTSARAMVRYQAPLSMAQATRMAAGSDPDRVQLDVGGVFPCW
jgi:hypothetical protein